MCGVLKSRRSCAKKLSINGQPENESLPIFGMTLYRRRLNAYSEIVMTATNATVADTLSLRGMGLLAAGSADEAVRAFRAAIEADAAHVEAHHGLVRALRDAGRLDQSVAAARALTALTPSDPLAHTALSIALQHAGRVPEAEAAAGRARILEWKIQLQSGPEQGEDAEHDR
jgi:Flp pilus assembly protein TadD